MGSSFDIPALVPQVYLHYDPYDQLTRRGLASGTPLARQRMDFLLLFSDRQRVVIEVDGKQHYADGDHASPSRYSAMVAEDRRLRLAGYEVPVFWPPVWGAPRQGCKRTDGFDATGRMGALGGGWLLPRCVACRV